MFLIACISWPIAWHYIAKRQIGFGKHWFFAHLIGLVAGFFVFFSVVLFLMSIDLGTMRWTAIAFGGFTLWSLRLWASPPVVKPSSAAPVQQLTQPALQQSPTKAIYSGEPSDYEGDGSDLIRKYSGKSADDDLAELLAEIESDAKPKKRARKLVKVPVSGLIAFDYIDSKHELSSRVVDVKEVDARHISGYCRTARAFRTFLIDGVLSDVTDTDTGEVMLVDTWIKRAKKAARAGAPKK